MYDDEGDNYNYEKGMRASYTLNWNDKAHTLTITTTKGSFAGMVKARTFNIVLVRPGHGVNTDASQSFDKTVRYSGKMLSVKI